jgi:SpoVK/Ycf46/Vps4 family AAA+-type ATPase
MLNKRNKAYRRFKSSTDINNYNNFLIELDRKQKEAPTIQSNTCFHSGSSAKNEIKQFVEQLDNTFVSWNFTGITPCESLLTSIEKQLDPNLYQNDNNILEKEKEKRRKKEGVEEKEKEGVEGKEHNTTPIHTSKVNIVTEINNIEDLLLLIETYPDTKETEYNIDIPALHKIKQPLTELNNMIGMKDLKENIVDQIIFYIQNLHTLKSDIKGNDFMHTVIYGPPGTGKTEIAKIIGSIFSKMGVLTKGTFRKVTRADLIAGYLGQTALKTRDVVKDCLGGVLFIDEAYALGNEEKRDSFSKECIDTLCEALSDHKDNLMVIIAGYETDLNNCFFNYNQGLNSRFTWRFKTDEYSGDDLHKIFLKKVSDGGWGLVENSNIDVKWFEKNKEHFKFYGRDIETLFAKTKIAHSRRVFCLDQSVKKLLVLKDLDKGFEIYLKNEDSVNKEKEKEKDKNKNIISSMYV